MKGLIRGIMTGSAAAVAGMVALSQLAPPPVTAARQTAAPVVTAPLPQDGPDARAAAAAPLASAQAPAAGTAAARPPAGLADAPRLSPVPPAAPVRTAMVPAPAPAIPAALSQAGPAVAAAPPRPATGAADTRPIAPDAPDLSRKIRSTPPAVAHHAVAARADPPGPAALLPLHMTATAPPVPSPPRLPAMAWLPHPPPAIPTPRPAARIAPGDTFISDRPLVLPAQGEPTPPPAPGTTVRRGTAGTPADTPGPGAIPAAPAPDAPPLLREAGTFAPVAGRPPLAIILLDTLDGDPAAVGALPFPVTIAIDPLAPDAASRAAAYRAAGHEVLMLLTALPQGATASDIEQNLAVMASTLPQAVGAMDGPEAQVQNDLQAAGQLVSVLAAQGRGLVTWDVGLDAAARVARREGLPAATIFRRLDGAGEDRAAIRRTLDRAAFRAVQAGEVAVAGETNPATIAALVEWAAEGRAATVNLAPASALMSN